MFPELQKVGYISKAHGFKGGLKWELETTLHNERTFPPFFWIFKEGKPVPFAVKEINLIEDLKAILFLEDVTTEELAMKLHNHSVFCEASICLDYFEEGDQLDSIIGFKVIDKKKGAIGTLQEILPHQKQPILVLMFEDKEILIPYTMDIVGAIDHELQTIEIEAPEGLIDMYLD